MKTIRTECVYCNNEFEYVSQGGKARKYCSLSCQRRSTAKRRNEHHKDLVNDYSHKGYLSKEIINIYKGRCAICGWRATEKLIETARGKQYAYGNEIHHIVSVADGGKANFDNLILLCPNHHKQANLGIITPEQIRKYLRKPLTDEDKFKMASDSVDRVAAAIFNSMQDEVIENEKG